jgi:hypothetical protein
VQEIMVLGRVDMGLNMGQRKSLIAVTAARYRSVGKREKKRILDELVQTTGYERRYASLLLRTHGAVTVVNHGLRLVGDVGCKHKRKRGVQRQYGEREHKALVEVWMIMDCICGKRLAAAMGEVIPILERHNEIRMNKQSREKLLRISAATIDRMLAPERKKYEIRGRSGTKPGTLLKKQVAIRTWAQWDEGKPGFVEIDLVGHEGGNASGDFCQSLDVTDVQSAWTETMAVKNKAQIWVFEALQQIRTQLPFDSLGIDSDNGSEFINDQFIRYCEQEKITFTRGRPSRKNDNCYVEQKNYTVVRRAVGYARYDTQQELEVLNELYSHLRLYTNFFQPVMKLESKQRVGSKVTKRYDKPLTPYGRLLQSPHISKESKQRLRRRYATLNPADLKRKIEACQDKLLRLASAKQRKKA